MIKFNNENYLDEMKRFYESLNESFKSLNLGYDVKLTNFFNAFCRNLDNNKNFYYSKNIFLRKIDMNLKDDNYISRVILYETEKRLQSTVIIDRFNFKNIDLILTEMGHSLSKYLQVFGDSYVFYNPEFHVMNDPYGLNLGFSLNYNKIPKC